MDFYFKISIGLLLVAVFFYLFSKIEVSKKKRAIFSVGFFVSTLLYIIYYAANSFTGEGINDAVIFTIAYGLNDAGVGDYKKLIGICLAVIFISLLISLWLFFKKGSVYKQKIKKDYILVALLLLVASFIINPLTVDLYKILYSEIFSASYNSDFYKIYSSPEITQIGKPKNLVFIYAESLEKTYFDEKIFPGLTENLKEIAKNSVSFSNIEEAKGATFTMGGIVASQCGIQLITPYLHNSDFKMNSFLKNAVCLGDLLRQKGYYLSFLGGASLNFSGKGAFFRTHGFDEALGRNELLPKLTDKDYLNYWGLYDDSLFDLDYDNFIKLSESKKKFAMFTLSIDTHQMGTLEDRSCKNIIYGNGSSKTLNSVACSDYLISNFINRIRQSQYSDDTIIVLASDHLAMGNDATNLLNQGARKILLLVNTPDKKEGVEINKPGTTFDIGSTMLPFIGYKSNIGFGSDIVKRDGIDSKIVEIQNNLSKYRKYMNQFWDYPKIKNSIKINPDENTVYLDGKPYGTPILIEINNKLETKLSFKFTTRKNTETGFETLKIGKNKSFMLIDKCLETNKFSLDKIDYPGYCLLAGKGGKQYSYIRVDKNYILALDEIKKLLTFKKYRISKVYTDFSELK